MELRDVSRGRWRGDVMSEVEREYGGCEEAGEGVERGDVWRGRMGM